MAYSIHGHISYILETNSMRPNDFFTYERKQMKFYKTYCTKIQTKNKFKIYAEAE